MRSQEEIRQEEVEQEIAEHGKTWCSSKCQTFLPHAYEDARRKHSKTIVQSDYDMCHMFR